MDAKSPTAGASSCHPRGIPALRVSVRPVPALPPYPIGQGAGRGGRGARDRTPPVSVRADAARCRKRCQRSACTRVLKGAGRCSGWPQTPAHCWVAGHSLLRLTTLARVSTALHVEHDPQQPALFELPAACGMPRPEQMAWCPQSAFDTCPVATGGMKVLQWTLASEGSVESWRADYSSGACQ